MDKLECAIVLDLCGHELNVEGREQALFIAGGDTTCLSLADLTQLKAKTPGLDLCFLRDRQDFHLSDHLIFSQHGQPNLFLTCAPAYYYHTPDDTFDRLSPNKMAKIAELLKELVLQVDRSGPGGEKPNWRGIEVDEIGRFLGEKITENGLGFIIRRLLEHLHKKGKVSMAELRGERVPSTHPPIVIEPRAAIDAFEDALEKTIRKAPGAVEISDVTVDVAFGAGQTEVFYNGDLEFGFCRRPVCPERKWWNSFFVDRPTTGSKVPEFCEINVSFDGSTGQTQGAFVGDHGRIYLVHRGLIKGASRLEEYQGSKRTVQWGKATKEVIVVCEVGSSEAPQQIAAFLKEIKRILE